MILLKNKTATYQIQSSLVQNQTAKAHFPIESYQMFTFHCRVLIKRLNVLLETGARRQNVYESIHVHIGYLQRFGMISKKSDITRGKSYPIVFHFLVFIKMLTKRYVNNKYKDSIFTKILESVYQ